MSDAGKAIFLSYAREDSAAAARIAEALRSQGVEVWFDQNELRGGDSWDQKIKTQIRQCALFLPIVSAHTQERGEGYFRREWRLAVERTHDMAEGVPFLAPVVIDDTPDSAAAVPDPFLRVQWTRLPGALPTPQFVEQVKRLLAAPRTPVGSGTASRSAGGVGAEAAPLQRKPRVPAWVWSAFAGGVIAVALAWMAWKNSPRPAAPAASTSPPVSTAAQPPLDFASAKSTDKSIAVLPFANLSDDKDANAFFADGIHEDILTNLALIRELRVVSRSSVMGYRAESEKGQVLGFSFD